MNGMHTKMAKGIRDMFKEDDWF
ncbi:uncharacterized protein METZ01_LOCUS100196 [marine metagenome]|uniref:Uncharacterized protein n=1 Tax=marine metagenome TaxID=408172 RepID=A0A381W4G5_9ZZZZ